jgi:Brp/Blh family beta-carotene 15,15'-monooxygenase
MGRPFPYAIAATLTAIFLLFPLSDRVVNSVCILSILLIGIPHGAIDHKIHLAISKKNSVSNYIIRYLLISVGYLIWWLLMPLKAFILFILLSAYHFGQELIEDNAASIKLPITYMFWGSIILIIPLLLNLAEIDTYIRAITGISFFNINSNLILILIITLFTLTFLDLIRIVKKGIISKSAAFNLIVFAIYISLSYLILPFLIAFTFYFILFHSSNALTHQYLWFKSYDENYSIKKFIQDLSLLSIIAITGIILITLLLDPQSWVTVFSYIFIFISLLTLPHSMVFDQLYAKKRSSENHIVPN